MIDQEKEMALREITEFMGLIVIPAGTKPIGQIKHPEISEAFLRYNMNYNDIHKIWIKFRDLKFEEISDENYGSEYSKFYNIISYSLLNESIEKAFEELSKAIKWFNSLKK